MLWVKKETELKKNSGSCGCGSVNYELNMDELNVVNCHCDMCRNHNGSSFSTYAIFPIESLDITTGSEFINKYIANGGEKHFCHKCGTPLFNVHEKYPGVRMIYLGTLNETKNITPKINVWCESKLSWIDGLASITSLPQG